MIIYSVKSGAESLNLRPSIFSSTVHFEPGKISTEPTPTFRQLI